MKASPLRLIDGGDTQRRALGKAPKRGRPSKQDAAQQPDLGLGSSAEELAAVAERLAKRKRSLNTLSGYTKGWGHFCKWCLATKRQPLPASTDTVRYYLAFYGSGDNCLKATTLKHRLAAITFFHRDAGHETPTRADAVRDVLTGIRRTQAADGNIKVQKMPLRQSELWEIARLLAKLDTLAAKRNRAILLLGFAMAGRRSPISRINVADLKDVPQGLLLTIRTDKTDQDGKGRDVPIWRGDETDCCPVRAYKDWITAAGIKRGAVFRGIDRHGNLSQSRISDRAIALIIKASVALIGLEPEKFGGHSLRAGYATSAHEAGAADMSIALITGHKDQASLREYFRDLKLFDNNPMKPSEKDREK